MKVTQLMALVTSGLSVLKECRLYRNHVTILKNIKMSTIYGWFLASVVLYFSPSPPGSPTHTQESQVCNTSSFSIYLFVTFATLMEEYFYKAINSNLDDYFINIIFLFYLFRFPMQLTAMDLGKYIKLL